jgi:Fic family protein
MRSEDFGPGAFGRLVPITGGHAFIPSRLPPRIDFSAELSIVLSEAERALGALNGIGRILTNPHLLIFPYLHREAVLSSRIEGTQASVSDVLRREAGAREERPDDVQEVINYVDAMWLGLRRITEIPLCLNLAREIHRELLTGVRGASRAPGEFRRLQIHIGPPGTPLSAATYVPPPANELDACLDDWEKNLHQTDLPPLVHCAVLHYQFEAIHPFLDGNGRVGRLLNILYLVSRHVLLHPMLYLSAYFEEHRTAYYDLLLGVSQNGEWWPWIQFFLEGIRSQATSAATDCGRLLRLRDELSARLSRAHARPTAIRMIDLLFTNPYVQASRVAEHLDVSFPSAMNAIDQLVEMGLLREITGQKRNRMYVAPDVLAVVEGDASPERPEVENRAVTQPT